MPVWRRREASVRCFSWPRTMRSLSFRSLFLLLMVTPVVVSTVVLSWLSYRAASEVLIQDAIRAVKISAKAREQALLNRLFRQRERATGFLSLVDKQCSGPSERERRGCYGGARGGFPVPRGGEEAPPGGALPGPGARGRSVLHGGEIAAAATGPVGALRDEAGQCTDR